MKKIITEIDNIIYAPKTPFQVIVNLTSLRALLNKSLFAEDDRESMSKLRSALYFIEAIKVESPAPFWDEKKITTIRDGLIEKKYSVLPGLPQIRFQPYPVPVHAQPLFEKLYYSLVISELKGHAWSYEYPLDDDSDEIMNLAILKWKQPYLHRWRTRDPFLHEQDQSAYRDFRRKYTIGGKFGKNDEEITELIEDFVNSASYLPNERQMLKDWLAMYGGQNNNRFVDFLLFEGEFTPKETALGDTKPLENNWALNANKKISFNYTCEIYSIIMNGTIYYNNNGRLKEGQIDNVHLHYPPLLRISASIELSTTPPFPAVRPKIVSLKVTSFCYDLDCPKKPMLDSVASFTP